ncbi:MAG: DNA polymerase IV [Treponema sp.]|nr:DNA polymerase IV [Treponema sp.]
MKSVKHFYLHVDLDAFFASVEQLDNPQYRGKPLIVGGKPEDKRSVVSTASYEARKFGVHSAMPTAKAYQLCPQGIFVYPRMKRYSEISWQIMNIFHDFSPDVQQMSIDEAFIDLTGTENLFGSPKETAMKIKQRVKDETGLTVSVGLAPTKYLAKIASDMNKPDGFYCIPEGSEQEFMLNLPLKKVWGIGDKTYASLKTNGLFTTRDIYEKSLESLVFMYGNNMGNFLYNVVRGIEIINFDRKTKSHSVSNETTFPFDIYDIYTIETSILELCHSLIFRLLKENGFSRTVMVKIRYEDFSTVSIQQTYSRSILTLDSLFACAKELFEKKYEHGRGIRLIGIGLENIENSEKPFQPGLFDDDSEKKQNVEKAILSLKKKHPEINIQKARMLEKVSGTKKIKKLAYLFPLILGLLFAPKPASAYEIEGYWKGEMDGSIDTTFGMGNPFGFSAPLPVFKQEVDISAFVDITPHFTFSLQFLDEFKNNTYTLNYQNQSWLEKFVFSNRGITLPTYYSSVYNGYDVTGGNNEAPGIMLHFNDVKNNKWMADIMLRYEMTESKSVVFYGSNSVRDTDKELTQYVVSDSFVIPSDVINQISGVYIQTNNGLYKDSHDRTFTKLDASDYLIVPQKNLLMLSQAVRDSHKNNTTPYIVLTFSSADACTKLLQDTGTYSQPQSFAGKIQSFFGSLSDEFLLSDFSTLDAASLIIQIDGKQGFIIQSPYAFSPYACANKYEFSGGSDCDFFIKDRYTKTETDIYTAEAASNASGIYGFISESFFNEKNTFAYIVNSKEGIGPLDPEYRYPLADRYPQVYVGLNSQSPYVITARHYTAVNEYDIGKKVSNGTVRVYINGILDAGAVYDSNTGFVTLSAPAGELDKIYITYSEEGSLSNGGAFTTGLGFVWSFMPWLKADLSFTGQYPFTPGKHYATAETTDNSFSSLTAGINLEMEKIKAYDAVSAAFQNENLSKTMLAVAFEDSSSQTFYLSSSAGSQLDYTPLELDPALEHTVYDFTGKSDSYISGYKIPLQFNFQGAGLNQNVWAAVELSIPNAKTIYSAQDFEMAFLPDSSLKDQNLDVYLQLCTNTYDDQAGATWLITSTTDKNVLLSLDINNPSWQTVRVRLTDSQRSKLHNCTIARLIIVKKSFLPGSDKTTGILYAGPYKVCRQPVFISSNPAIQASANIVKDRTSSASKDFLELDANAVELTWTVDSLIADEQNRKITALSWFTPVDFSSYESLNFDFALTQNADLIFELEDSNQDSALYCRVKKEALQGFVSNTVTYHTLSINTDSRKVLIDGTPLTADNYELEINRLVIPCLYRLTIIPEKNGLEPYTGKLYAGSVYYKNSSPSFSMRNQVGFNFKDGKAYVDAVSSQGLALKTADNSIMSSYINSSLNTGITLKDIFLGADAEYGGGLKTAGHSAKSVSPVFKVISFEETYRYSLTDKNREKKNYLAFDFEKLKVPLKLDSKIVTRAVGEQKEYSSASGINSSFAIGRSKLSFNSALNLNGKNQRSGSTPSSNYFYSWYDLSALEFTDGSQFNLRNVLFTTSLTGGFPVAELTPSILFELSGNKAGSQDNSYITQDFLLVSIPFGFKNNSFSLGVYHKSGIEQNLANNNFADDLGFLFTSQNQFANFYKAIPLYTIFKSDLTKSLSSVVNQNSLQAITQTMQYNFAWKRKLYNSLHDIYVPSGLSADFSRDITSTKTDSLDIYQLRTTLNWNAINLFGSNAATPVFSWYRQEENISSLSAAWKFSAHDAPAKSSSLVINSFGQLLFYIADNSTLTLQNEESVSSSLYDSSTSWKVSLSASWERDTPKSLTLELTKLILAGQELKDLKTTVKDSASITIGHEQDILTQSYEYSRSSNIQFHTNYYLTSKAGLLFGYTQNKTMRLSLKYNLGLKINF